MAEITKITTPLMPRENVGNKFKPDTDQAFDLNDLSKVHKPAQDGRIYDRQPDNQSMLRESMGRAAIQSILKNSGDLVGVIKRMALLVESGVSTTQTMNDPAMKELLDSLFLTPRQLMDAIVEQDKSAVLFKGEAFDVLRDLLAQFKGNTKINNAVAHLLKVFEHNVNTTGSIKAILLSCENILDYMFTKDREQFADYLDGLAATLLPEGDAPEQAQAQNPQTPPQSAEAPDQEPAGQAQPQVQAQAQAPGGIQEQAPVAGNGAVPLSPLPDEVGADSEASPPETADRGDARQPSLNGRDASQILKGNLLPLLGEVVVKYHQNERIRDHVMTVVHNIVRVDQGSPEALSEAVRQLVQQLRQYTGVPENFSRELLDALAESGEQARDIRNGVMEKLTAMVSEALRSEGSSPSVLRQAENLLVSMLQNQSTMMNVLHFVLPLQTESGQIFAELYVDPDNGTDTKNGNSSRKFFLSFDSENHGSFEISFIQTNEHVDFAMWCPGPLVKGLSGLRRYIGDIMQTHGYTMNSFQIEELRRQQSIADVFPRLLERRVGIDVRV